MFRLLNINRGINRWNLNLHTKNKIPVKNA